VARSQEARSRAQLSVRAVKAAWHRACGGRGDSRRLTGPRSDLSRPGFDGPAPFGGDDHHTRYGSASADGCERWPAVPVLVAAV